MNKKKKITLAVAILLVFCLAIGGTLAWLIDTTPTVKNTFTMGKVKIKLDEANLATENPDDRTETGNSYHLVPGDKVYTKDPTVTVLKGSEPCYVRMFVKVTLTKTADQLKTALMQVLQTNPEYLAELVANGWLIVNQDGTYSINKTKLMGCIEGWHETSWTREGPWYGGTEAAPNKQVGIVEYRYTPGIVARDDTGDNKLPALFAGFKFPADFPTDLLDALAAKLNVEVGELIPTVEIVAQAIQAEGFTNAATAWSNSLVKVPAGYEHAGTALTLPDPLPIPTP